MHRRAWTGILAALAAALIAAPTASADDRCKGEEEPVTASNIVPSERVVLCLTNLFRAENSLPPLTHDGNLRQAARDHAEDVVTYDLDNEMTNPAGPHYNPYVPGKYSPQDRANRAGYQGSVGENIAWSSFPVTTPDDLVEAWKRSPGHRANLLGDDPGTPGYDNLYVTAGMGLAIGNGVTGVQMFGTEDNGATDTAVDLLITEECAEAKADAAKAKRKLKRARKRLQNADSEAEQEEARERLRKARRKAQKAERQVRRECRPTSY